MNVVLNSMVLLGIGFHAQDKPMPTLQYFRTFTGYSLPLKLVQPIPKEEALASKDSVYVGYFDEVGRLVKIEKFLKHKLVFTHEYEFHVNGKLKRLVNTPVDGVPKVKEYDGKGKLLKESKAP